ncbi:MAG: hypothetical protein WCI65_00810 [Synechococcaceae cyanobacterium ELA263]
MSVTALSLTVMPLIAMASGCPPWRRLSFPAGALAALLVILLTFAGSALADTSPSPLAYSCDGERLTALLVSGAVDDPTMPDPSRGPVPMGGFVVLQWRELSLQLPRTNNAGPASFTDGKWWWSLEDPAHPRFRLRQGLGNIQDLACEQAG